MILLKAIPGEMKADHTAFFPHHFSCLGLQKSIIIEFGNGYFGIRYLPSLLNNC